MTDFVQHPVVQALAWALMHFLWQGAAIGLVVLVAARVVRSAPVRYAIGVGALAAMLAAPAATFVLVLSDSVGSVPTPMSLPASVTESAAGPALVSTGRAAASAIEWSSPLAFRVSPDVLAVAVMGWIAGVVFFSIRLLGGWVVARRLARNAVRPASDAMQALARELCDRLQVRRAVRILESSALRVPVMVGWIRPAIVLPMAALASLSPTQVEALLAHELAHVRRHDYLVNLLQSLTEAFLFYHPAVWWLSRQVRADRELCCDDLAVGVCDRLVYATALTDLATLASPGVALAATDGNLLGRIRRILGQTDETAAVRAGVMPALALALVAGVAVPVVLASATAAPEPPRAQDETTIQLIGQVLVERSADRVSVASDAAKVDVDQTPAQQADRQRQIEEIRKKIAELQNDLARLEENRGANVGVATAEVRDRQALAEQQQKAALAKQADIEKLMEKMRQGANADQEKALIGMQKDMEKMRAERASAVELQKQAVDKQELTQALQELAAKQSAEATAQVDRAAAEREFERSRELFLKGLITQQQLREAEMALQKTQAAGDPAAEAAVRLNEANAQLARQMALLQKGLITQQQVDQTQRQIVMLERQLLAAQLKASVDQSPERVGTDARSLFEQMQRIQTRGYAVNSYIPLSLEPAPNQDAPVKSGDILRIAIAGEPDLPPTYTVTEDGTIRLPFIGAIKVGGLKATEVRAALGKQLSDRKLGSASQVAVTLMRSR